MAIPESVVIDAGAPVASVEPAALTAVTRQ